MLNVSFSMKILHTDVDINLFYIFSIMIVDR